MRMKNTFSFVLLFMHVFYSQTEAACDLSMREEDKEFPDIFKEAFLSYELLIEYKILGEKPFNFGKEYYDSVLRSGRTDIHSDTGIESHYYFQETNETFSIKGLECKREDIKAIPDYYKYAMTEWLYEKENEVLIMGPSAMLMHALDSWNCRSSSNPKMAYMGIYQEKIRGIYAQYWRRCNEDLQFDYFFTLETIDNYKLKIIPLQVRVTEDGNSAFYPQTTDIISFQPYVTDIKNLAIPPGKGCDRITTDDDPELPDFSYEDLFLFGEVIHFNNDENSDTYLGNFMFTLNRQTQHLAYHYTPLLRKATSQIHDSYGPKHSIYDMKNNYLYTKYIFDDVCKIERTSVFRPKFDLPYDNGYLELTDPAILFPSNEFSFIARGIDRKMPVLAFEATMMDYRLGDRIVPKVIITRNYLEDYLPYADVTENALTSIQMKLFDKKDGKHVPKSEIIINVFGFTTNLEMASLSMNHVYDITPCHKDADVLLVTLGFKTESSMIDKIKTNLKTFASQFKTNFLSLVEFNPMRMSSVMVDFKNMTTVFVTFTIMDKPPVELDFLKPEDNISIETVETEGFKSFDDCATGCLESTNNCWGFSLCGTTCYYGVGQNKTKTKDGCKLYRRYSNTTFEQSNENIEKVSKTLVMENRMKIDFYLSEEAFIISLSSDYFEFKSLKRGTDIFCSVNKEYSVVGDAMTSTLDKAHVRDENIINSRSERVKSPISKIQMS